MVENRVALITDSTCDIPDELLLQYDITYVPSYLVWGAQQLRDRLDLRPEEFYRRLETDPVYPTTACPTPGDFAAAYRQARAEGAQEIVVVTISSAMSGTHQSARQAADSVDIPVHLVDAGGPTMSVGWQVLAAARAREAAEKAGAAVDAVAQDMVAAADRVRAGIVQFVCLDTLEYLYKGGRVGGATRFIGSLLNVKPIVHINHANGLVEAFDRIRTHKRAVEAFYQGFFSLLGTSTRSLRIAVLHGDALAEAQRLAERIADEFHPIELLITMTSPVLGVHTGPRALALCGYADE